MGFVCNRPIGHTIEDCRVEKCCAGGGDGVGFAVLLQKDVDSHSPAYNTLTQSELLMESENTRGPKKLHLFLFEGKRVESAAGASDFLSLSLHVFVFLTVMRG